MKITTLFIAACLTTFFILSSVASGQASLDGTTYSLETAIQTALRNNRSLKTALLEVEKSDAQVSEAFSYALPSVNVSANFTHNMIIPQVFLPAFLVDSTAPEGTFAPVVFQPANAYNAAVELTQTLFNSAVFTGIGTSKVYSNIAREQLRGKIVQTVASTKKAFYSALVAAEVVELYQASVENAEKNFREVQVLYEQGLAPEYDALRAEVAVENLRPSLIEAESNYENALNNLKVTVERNNFDLKALRLQQQFQQEAVAVYRAEYLPQLSGFVNFANFSQANNLNFTPLNSSAAGLRLSLSLFNGFLTDSKVEQALIDVEKVKAQESETSDAYKAQAYSLVQRIETAKKRIRSLDRTVSQAQRGYDIASARYAEGIGAQIEVADADLALRQSRINRLQALLDLYTSEADLTAIVGDFDGSYEKLVKP